MHGGSALTVCNVWDRYVIVQAAHGSAPEVAVQPTDALARCRPQSDRRHRAEACLSASSAYAAHILFGAGMGAFRWFSLFFFIWLACGAVHAERRVALVIGNSAYKSAARLANPANDAALVGGMFKNAGFDWIDTKTDLNAAEMRRALRDFGGRARGADVAVIYYAGHGIELDGTNYLIPIDAALETDSDVLDETVGLERALFAVEPAKQLRLIILDACRDNPFAKTMKRTVASR